MPKQEFYIAVPENVFKAVIEYLRTRPYGKVEDGMIALKTTAKKIPAAKIEEIHNQAEE
jgi:hypothetical protein